MVKKPTNKSKPTRKKRGPARSVANIPRARQTKNLSPPRKSGGSRGKAKSVPFAPFNEDSGQEDELTPEEAALLDSMEKAQRAQQARDNQDEAEAAPSDLIPTVEWFVERRLDTFLHIVGHRGVHPHVAAAMEGVTRSVFDSWMQIGKRDYEAHDLTASARLYSAMIRAIAKRRALAEETVSFANPLEYLRRGNARLLGEEWVEVKEMALADKAGLLIREGSGQVLVGGAVPIIVSTMEQVMLIMKEYVTHEAVTEDVKTIDASISNRTEHLVKNRVLIDAIENPKPINPEPVNKGISLNGLKQLRGA